MGVDDWSELDAPPDVRWTVDWLISAGFDSHRLDPVGSLGLETEDFIPLTEAVIGIADQYCDGRIVSVLEGGYNVDVLPHCVEAHLDELIQASEDQQHA